MSEAAVEMLGGRAVTTSCIVVEEVVEVALKDDVVRKFCDAVVVEPELASGTVCNPRETDDPTLATEEDDEIVATVGIPAGIDTSFNEVVV